MQSESEDKKQQNMLCLFYSTHVCFSQFLELCIQRMYKYLRRILHVYLGLKHTHTQTHTALCVWLGAICCWALCWRVNCRDTAVHNSVPRRVVPALKSHSTIALPPLAPTEPISCPSLSRVPGAWPSTSFCHHLWHVREKTTVRDPGPQPDMQTHIVQPLFQSTQLG